MRALFIAFIAFLAIVDAAIAKPPQNEQERQAAVNALRWRDSEALTLPLSNGTLKASEPVKQLVGADAQSLYEILNGVDAPNGLEATLYDPRTNELVFYQKFGGGYVRLDDWEDVDADAMLKSVTEGTEEANAKRRAAGIAPLHVTGWLERPHLDRASNSVRWAIELTDEGGGPLVNSIALVLGRDGFEKLTWTGEKKVSERGLLKSGLAAFGFPIGERYEDYRSGDKVAEYGIAGLVAAVLGTKLAAKLGLVAVIAVFAKKFWWLVLVPITLGYGWFKRVMAGRKPPTPPQS